MTKVVFGIFALCFLIWCTSVAFKGMGSGPDVVFESLLGDPAQVSDLDGFVRTGDGYDVQIRFRAEEDWLWSLSHLGFIKADCKSVSNRIRFSIMRVAAWPPWRPEDLADVTCFRRTGENDWSPRGRDQILAESRGGWVYFDGEGSEHTRALPSADDAEYPDDE